ncbi:hypothetical protein Leryth_007894 [Lithospermum erythrorhizon]|nr:hypothetical protein Leryth_007894 [Lithospermum erythrorhizon]
MQSLNLKMTCPRQLCGGGVEYLAEKRRLNLRLPPCLRRIVLVSVSSEKNDNGGAGETQNPISSLTKSQTYALLKQQMEVAAKSEDFEEAARLRDSLKEFEEEEPVLRIRKLLKEAIADERFEDAANMMRS